MTNTQYLLIAIFSGLATPLILLNLRLIFRVWKDGRKEKDND